MNESQYRIFKAVLLLIVSAGAFSFLAEGVKLEVDLRRNLDTLNRPVLQLAANWNSVAVTSSQVLAKERNSFDSQQAYFTKLGTDTDALFGGINGNVLPRITTVLDRTTVAVDSIGSSSVDLAQSGSASLGQLTPLIEAVTARVNDPRYDSMLSNADLSMASLSKMMADGAAVTSNVKTVSDYYTKKVLAPVSKLKAGVLFSASVLGRILRIL